MFISRDLGFKRLRRLLLVVLILIGACASTITEENMQRATAHYKLGVSYLNENNVQSAFVEFQKALELNPNDKEVLNAIGVIYLLKLEDFQKAIDFFQRAIRVDQNFSDGYNNLGFAYEKAGRFNDAIDSYKKALSNPVYRTAEKAYNNLGRVYYRLGRYDEAIDAYKEAIKRVADFHPSYYGLALCYNAKGKYGDASTAIVRAIELDPLYRGDKAKAIHDLRNRKIRAKADDEKDIENWLEILKY